MRGLIEILARLGACACIALPLLAGCGKAPKGQIVAVVDDEEISTHQITAEMEGIVIPSNAVIDPKQLHKEILQGLIDRQMEVAEARARGLDKTPEFLALKNRNGEELLASMLGHKVAQTVPLPLESEVRQYIWSHPLQFARRQRLTVDQLSFAPPRDTRRLRILANAHSLEEADAALHSLGIATVRGQTEIDTAQADPEIAAALDRAPPGEPFLLPQGKRLAVGVISSRAPIQASPEDSYVAAARAVRAATLLHESQAQIAQARSTADIWYEPGWGPGKAATKR